VQLFTGFNLTASCSWFRHDKGIAEGVALCGRSLPTYHNESYRG
jgi:hypothetical protein